MNEHNRRQTHYLALILKCFDIYFLSESKSSFITSSVSSFIMISMLSLFECITRSSSLSKEEIKLFAIVNCTFHVSFMISFKYGLILLKYSSTYSVLFLPLLLSYSICDSESYLLLLIYNNFPLLHSQKDFHYL